MNFGTCMLAIENIIFWLVFKKSDSTIFVSFETSTEFQRSKITVNFKKCTSE